MNVYSSLQLQSVNSEKKKSRVNSRFIFVEWHCSLPIYYRISGEGTVSDVCSTVQSLKPEDIPLKIQRINITLYCIAVWPSPYFGKLTLFFLAPCVYSYGSLVSRTSMLEVGVAKATSLFYKVILNCRKIIISARRYKIDACSVLLRKVIPSQTVSYW